MSSHLFRRLRRCRALFVLALCAWLALGSTAWAKADCCASTDMQGMSAMHAGHDIGHPHGHATNHGECACACLHAPVDQLTAVLKAANPSLCGQSYARTLPQSAPQLMFAPPLRPPSV